MRPVIKYVSLVGGRCGLSVESPKNILRTEGENNVEFVRDATKDEVEWIRAMGGKVPEGRIAERK